MSHQLANQFQVLNINSSNDDKLSHTSVLADNRNFQNYHYKQAQIQQIMQKSLQVDDSSITDYIEVLLDHQKECEKSGKYVEAEMTKNRISELKKEYSQRKREEMKKKHQQDKQHIEQIHLNEFNQLNKEWDQKMFQFNQQADEIQQQLIQKHQQELEKFLQELDNYIPLKPKDSAELLNLKKIQENLARQQNYVEAHLVQQQAIQLEKKEYEKWQTERNIKTINLKNQLETRQQNELQALKKRIVSSQDEQKKMRSSDLEILLQKYTNVKKDLEVQQQKELEKYDKILKNQGNSVHSSKSIHNKSSFNLNNSIIQRYNKDNKKIKQGKEN